MGPGVGVLVGSNRHQKHVKWFVPSRRGYKLSRASVWSFVYFENSDGCRLNKCLNSLVLLTLSTVVHFSVWRCTGGFLNKVTVIEMLCLANAAEWNILILKNSVF